MTNNVGVYAIKTKVFEKSVKMCKVDFLNYYHRCDRLEPSNITLITDHLHLDLKSSEKILDVYEGQTWFSEGCSSGDEFEIEEGTWEEY